MSKPSKKSAIPAAGAPGNPLLAVGERLRHPKAKGRLARLLAQVNHLTQVNRIFHAYLAPHLRDHASLAKLDPDAWIVQTDSPVWATRLRYCLPSLRGQLAEHLGIEIPPLRIRIVPTATASAPPAPRRLELSQEAVKTLEGAARNLADHDLGAALLRLARHARKREA